jgi:hypothetical protein
VLGLDATGKIELYSILWGILLLFTLARITRARYGSVGLPFAFIYSYTVAHAGALVYLADWYEPSTNAYLQSWGFNRETVAAGLEVSCLAMIAASIGNVVAERWIPARLRARGGQEVTPRTLQRGSLILLSIGLIVLLIGGALGRTGIALHGLQAALASLQNLFVVGACGLVLHRYVTVGARRAMVLAGVFALLTPAVLLVTTAILAESIGTAMVIMSFYLTLRTRRVNSFSRNLAIVLASGVLGFFFAVFYLQSRGSIRNVVWGGSSIQSAVEVTLSSASRFDVDSAFTPESFALLDSRLDQNILIGLAVEYLETHPDDYDNGATVGLALLGWVPRFLWPNKPVAGGSEFVTKFTGIDFSRGTTVGAGPIFELYVNYGYLGVTFGFLLLGGLLRLIDVAAYRALRGGDLARFAQYMCAGIVFVSSLISLLFLVTGVAAALLIGWGLRFLWKRQHSMPAVAYAVQRF